jgi:hypothetical protein
LGEEAEGIIKYHEESDRYSARYGEMTPMIIKSIQELTERLEALENKLT